MVPENYDLKIILPLFVETGIHKKKKHILNLNYYRNIHCMVEGKIKKTYAAMVKNKVSGHSFTKKIGITYILYKNDKRKHDISNILAIHDKYLCDALVEWNVIADDSSEFLPEIKYYSGGVDKENGRVEVYICELNDKPFST